VEASRSQFFDCGATKDPSLINGPTHVPWEESRASALTMGNQEAPVVKMVLPMNHGCN
jgi:hypothetical protein